MHEGSFRHIFTRTRETQRKGPTSFAKIFQRIHTHGRVDGAGCVAQERVKTSGRAPCVVDSACPLFASLMFKRAGKLDWRKMQRVLP
jgi:hypothetical protein